MPTREDGTKFPRGWYWAERKEALEISIQSCHLGLKLIGKPSTAQSLILLSLFVFFVLSNNKPWTQDESEILFNSRWGIDRHSDVFGVLRNPGVQQSLVDTLSGCLCRRVPTLLGFPSRADVHNLQTEIENHTPPSSNFGLHSIWSRVRGNKQGQKRKKKPEIRSCSGH